MGPLSRSSGDWCRTRQQIDVWKKKTVRLYARPRTSWPGLPLRQNHPLPDREHPEVREGRCAAVRESRGLPSGRNGIVEEVFGLFEIAAAAGIEVEIGLYVGDAGQGSI